MELARLALRLAKAADDAERGVLLESHHDSTDVGLARALIALCVESWRSDPACVAGVAASLTALTSIKSDPEVSALAAWATGFADLTNGQMESAIVHINEAEERFKIIGQLHTAATTQVIKLYPLALLGRYDEAIKCGLRARDVLLTYGDTSSAGKIEHNLGNIYQRRECYQEAEEFLRAAHGRFAAIGDHEQLAHVDNSLAYLLSYQHRFREAEKFYKQALMRAEEAGLVVTQAAIESNLGYFALFQGRYDRALEYLERARRKYATLGMPHESAIAEQEMADAYLELNLVPEAAAIYAHITPTIAKLGLRAEQARALTYHGHASLLLGRSEEARTLLGQARALYTTMGSTVGEGLVALIESQLHYAEGNYSEAAMAASRAEGPFANAGMWGRQLLARWLRDDSRRAMGNGRNARQLLQATLHDAEIQAIPQVELRCHTSLGLLAVAERDWDEAEASFKRAVALIENLRAPLPAEEFRTAFFGDKLTPYTELLRLCLKDRRGARVAEALGYVERARARALVEMMSSAPSVRSETHDPFDAKLLKRLGDLREELNWLYSQINRTPEDEGPHPPSVMQSFHEAVREREGAASEIMRQLCLRGEKTLSEVAPLDLAGLQSDLGDDTVLLEYGSLDGQLLVFAVTDRSVAVVRDLASQQDVAALLEQLYFQIGAMRYGAARMRAHQYDLTLRARHYLRALYEMLLAPVEEYLGTRRLVVVPHGALHYVPFQALYDGLSYVIERHEVTYAPSANVLRRCLASPRHPLERALLMGVSDEQAPRVRDEINALAPLFSQAVALLDERATLASLREHAPAADVLHLACHGQFRPDNPLFSSLRLDDGWLTVRDACDLNLKCSLVVLSACETGVSAVSPGDEILGLARGFFSAGAPSLMLSLWNVDDEETTTLMADLYTRIRAGNGPAAALRQAQLQLMKRQPHPFFWSPFVLVGRW